jgi:hypothetical protein
MAVGAQGIDQCPGIVSVGFGAARVFALTVAAGARAGVLR